MVHGGTEELPKHVGDCVPIVFTFQCIQVWFDEWNSQYIHTHTHTHTTHFGHRGRHQVSP